MTHVVGKPTPSSQRRKQLVSRTANPLTKNLALLIVELCPPLDLYRQKLNSKNNCLSIKGRLHVNVSII